MAGSALKGRAAKESWLRGLTLGERARLLRVAGSGDSGLAPGGASTVKRCRAWFDQQPGAVHEWQRFLQRLSATEAKLHAWADPRSSELRGIPSWVATLTRLQSALQQPSECEVGRGLEEGVIDLLLQFAGAERHSKGAGQTGQLLSNSSMEALEALLRATLKASARQVLAWEAHLARQSLGRRKPCDPFVSGARAALLRLLAIYPALARLLATQIEHWIEFVGTFLSDTNAALSGPLRKRGIGSIRSIKGPLSDPHHGNRVALEVSFDDGSAWIYKPRSFRHEAGWFEVIAWLNARQSFEPLRVLTTFGDDQHCWVEVVRPRSCTSREELRRYYRNAGRLLYLAHLLRAVDLHAGNLIAEGSQPVILDLETLGHPSTRLPRDLQAGERSIYRTGLLPAGGGCNPIDSVSAFGRQAPGPHLPRLGDTPANARDYGDEMCAGLAAMHHLLTRDAEIAREFNLFADAVLAKQSRLILRPTIIYHRIREASCAPPLLMDGLERSAFLHRACSEGGISCGRIREEVEALEDGDIPRLQTHRRPARKIPSGAGLRSWQRAIRSVLVCLL